MEYGRTASEHNLNKYIIKRRIIRLYSRIMSYYVITLMSTKQDILTYVQSGIWTIHASINLYVSSTRNKNSQFFLLM